MFTSITFPAIVVLLLTNYKKLLILATKPVLMF
nr:MAG TPA: hypothetical protein [Caudoviricetes sp.]DAS32669.1 MAG TPA: hypothetical protein [Caudoviricetes sp.]